MRGSPQQIALVLRRKAFALERAVREAEAESLKEAVAVARSLSTGGLTREQLRAMGHPYGVGSSRPLPQSRALVNLQSGDFYLGWRGVGPRKSGDTLRSSIVNQSPVAPFILKGTSKMVARPFTEAIRLRIKANRLKRHRAALAAVHTGR